VKREAFYHECPLSSFACPSEVMKEGNNLLKMSESKKFILLGKILREWGIRGLLRFISYNPESEIYSQLKTLYLEEAGNYRPLKIQSAKKHGRFWLFKFEGYENPEEAKKLRLSQLALPRDEMPKTKAGEVYLVDMIGMTVEGHDGAECGLIKNFQRVGDSEVMIIDQGKGKEVMIPYRPEFVESTSMKNGVIVLKESAKELL
jgi:16S rRNA processing protein RimM